MPITDEDVLKTYYSCEELFEADVLDPDEVNQEIACQFRALFARHDEAKG
jgi:hypothetical protein